MAGRIVSLRYGSRMTSDGRVLVFAFDGCDPVIARTWAAAGAMPNLARMLAEGASAPVHAPAGVFVSANWPTIFTAVEPDRHRYLCWDEIDPATYEHRETEPNPSTVHGKLLWEALNDAGKRTVVLDVPHTWAQPINGKMLVEWACHDRHHGPHSWPTGLIDEVEAQVGRHPVGCMEPPGRDQFAPCDYLDREGALRTPAEESALLERLRAGVAGKSKASLALLEAGDWDVFITVFGEGHCVGHQLWHHHDPGHPRHDAAMLERLGGDPMLDIYRRIDQALGDHLERLEPTDTAYVLMPHGMGPHYDGTDVLDPLLDRLDRALDDPSELGASTRAARLLTKSLPGFARRAVAGRVAPLVRRRADSAPPSDGPVRPLNERRWYALPNNSVSGAVRLNLAGRERDGRIAPEARAEVLDWLIARLREVINIDTGSPVVREVVVTGDVYRRDPDDQLGDLYIEWERTAPIERVWSPSSGTVARPYRHWRTGDHIPVGLIVARGPGIAAAGEASAMRSVDVGATFAAAAGVSMAGVDGQAEPALLPAGASPGVRRRSLVGDGAGSLRRALSRLDAAAVRRSGRADAWEASGAREAAVAAVEVEGLAAAHHETREMVNDLRNRLNDLEREAQVWRTVAWLRQQRVTSGELISVIMPTHNRAALLGDAIRSVLDQTYPNWELIVVNDGSTDDTLDVLAEFDDPRIRVLSSGGVGSAAARNIGLEVASGSVIAYLDDDNRFDRDWLKAVAHTYATWPETKVAYGARLIDDTGRQHRLAPNGVVGIQLLPWDREAALEFNRVDMNVLTHRPGPARFDPALRCYVDWDLLLTLTAEVDPVEIPALAAYYTTDAPGRLTDEIAGRDDEIELDAVRAKHRRR